MVCAADSDFRIFMHRSAVSACRRKARHDGLISARLLGAIKRAIGFQSAHRDIARWIAAIK